MSWDDYFTAEGSFRGAKFIVRSDNMEFGRRTVVHEYPLRDKPSAEDLGKKARQFTIEVFVVGSDYMEYRDALIAEIEKGGPGQLIHPYFGTLQVSILSARKRESSREGGMATFTLTFIEGGDFQFTAGYKGTEQPVDDGADNLLDELIKDFNEVFSVLQQAADFVEEVQDEIDRTLAKVEATIAGVVDAATALIRTPYNMAVSITGSINRISATLNDPLRALSLYEGLFNVGSNRPSIPITTANRQQQANNVAALHGLVQRAAIAEAARISLSIEFASSDDALAVRDRLLEAIDAQMETAPDSIYQALASLRVAVAEDLRIRGARLPEITHYTPRAVLPALVLAYQIHGDHTRDEEIISRNNLSHPGFVAGAVALEILSADHVGGKRNV